MSETGNAESAGGGPVVSYETPSESIFAIVWCRILALWMLAWGIHSAATNAVLILIYMVLRSGSTPTQVGLQAAIEAFPPALWVVLAWICWRKAPRLASHILQGMPEPAWHAKVNSQQIIGLMLIGIGIFLLGDGIPAAMQALFRFLQTGRAFIWIDPLWTSGLAASVLQCGIGIWFILGARGLATAIRRLSDRAVDQSTHSPMK